MRFWSLASELDYAAAAPYAAIMVVLTLPITMLLLRQATRAATAS
jgi:iron(III) transport system permease protein